MTFTPASPASLGAFLAIVAGVLLAIIAGLYVACRRARESPTRPTVLLVSTLATWLGFFTAVVATGWPQARPTPLVPIVLIASLVVAIALGLSPLGRRLATLPLWMLVGFQSFRLPLELILHQWSLGGTIPQTMTWTGRNFDIVTGLVALFAAAALAIATPAAAQRVRHGIAWTANLVGLALLLNVIYVAVMSSPLPFAWPVDPPLQLLLHLPYAWIVPVCVAGALAGHVVLTRALLRA
jgi:hypothetical protein